MSSSDIYNVVNSISSRLRNVERKINSNYFLSNQEGKLFNNTDLINILHKTDETFNKNFYNNAYFIKNNQLYIGSNIDGENNGDESGHSVSLSSDGTIVAIGAINNDGVNSCIDTNDKRGHVRVYQRNTNNKTNSLMGWVQLGGDIDGEARSDRSGYSVSLSADGTIVAIGAYFNDGVNGDRSGHVRVYKYINNCWVQLGGDIDGEASDDTSGNSVSLSSDETNGIIVAIGASGNDGVNGTDSGHVRVYQWRKYTSSDSEKYYYKSRKQGTTNTKSLIITESISTAPDVGNYYWTQLGDDIDGEASSDGSGRSVSLSSDETNGIIVAIGAPSNGVFSVERSGHVRVYKYINESWAQLGGDIDGEHKWAFSGGSGESVSLSSDETNGIIVAIGASGNDGVNGTDSGHVRVYQWRKYTSSDSGNYHHTSREQGTTNTKSLIITESTSTPPDVGNYYWTQLGQDIDGEASSDESGRSVSLSSDETNGIIVAIGASWNDADGSDNNGHVRVYKYINESWVQLGGDIDGESSDDRNGYSVSLSSDKTNGIIIAIGAIWNDADSSDNNANYGHVRVYEYDESIDTWIVPKIPLDSIKGLFFRKYEDEDIKEIIYFDDENGTILEKVLHPDYNVLLENSTRTIYEYKNTNWTSILTL